MGTMKGRIGSRPRHIYQAIYSPSIQKV